MTDAKRDEITELLGRAVDARAGLLDDRHEEALRLFNGFFEGCPELVVDLYGKTVVLHDYGEPPTSIADIELAAAFLRDRLPFLRAAVIKLRNAEDAEARRGRLLFGDMPDRRVREHGVWYAIDLLLNRDTGFYADTRHLRGWALRNLGGAKVLNTFAYTGSLGVAARAAGASRVLQTDRSKVFLNLAKTSYTMNGFPIDKRDFVVGDFYVVVGRLKREAALFDCVFLDAPFFSVSPKGRVDLNSESAKLVNKVRPLVGDGGALVAINNALYVSGADYLRTLEELCADGYMALEEIVPVPEDFTGYPSTRVGAPPVDPAPFNHPTKIAILRVRRKDGRAA